MRICELSLILNRLSSYWLLIVFLLAISGIKAQTPAFFHLTLVNGLSDNNVRSIAIDRKGFLWAGCADGINVYDGYTITSYTHDNYPEVPVAAITQLLCDSHDSTWIGSAEATS